VQRVVAGRRLGPQAREVAVVERDDRDLRAERQRAADERQPDAARAAGDDHVPVAQVGRPHRHAYLTTRMTASSSTPTTMPAFMSPRARREHAVLREVREVDHAEEREHPRRDERERRAERLREHQQHRRGDEREREHRVGNTKTCSCST